MKRLRPTAYLLLSALTLSTVFTGCAPDHAPGSSSALQSVDSAVYSQDVYAMDTYMNLKAYGNDSEAAVKEAADLLYKLDSELSVTNQNSEIAKLNNRTSDTVTGNVLSILQSAVRMSALTNNYFDITVYPLVKAWGFTLDDYRVPSDAEISGLLPHVGMNRFTITPSISSINATPADSSADTSAATDTTAADTKNAATVSFSDPDTQLDTGAIAKGYASDRVYETLRSHDIQSAIVTLGGNVCALGSKTDGSKWRVAVQSPDDSGDYIGMVSVEDKFLVTSGGYQRYFEENGHIYHHILNPFTGKPAESGLSSVTIISDSGTEADALSTALYVMGLDTATDFWKNCTDLDFEAVFITDDGKIYVTGGVAEDFTAEKGNFEIISR